jgi:hypothetical protein
MASHIYLFLPFDPMTCVAFYYLDGSMLIFDYRYGFPVGPAKPLVIGHFRPSPSVNSVITIIRSLSEIVKVFSFQPLNVFVAYDHQ